MKSGVLVKGNMMADHSIIKELLSWYGPLHQYSPPCHVLNVSKFK